MRLQKIITGTPDDFFTVAGHFGAQLITDGTKMHMFVMTNTPKPWVRFGVVGYAGRGGISVIPRGDGGIELVVSAQDADWPYLEPVWLALWAELQRLGYASSETPESAQAATVERQAPPYRRERYEEVKKLWREGLSYEQIAEKLAVSVSTVKRDLKKHGLHQK